MRCLRLTAIALLALVLAISAGCERKIVMSEDGGGGVPELQCFGCHSDQEVSLVEARDQWATSNHGIGETVSRGASGTCRPCHSSEGFLQKVTGEDYSGEAVSKIACFTCHAPHTNETFALRTTEPVTLVNDSIFDKGKGNLCANCHHAREDATEYVYDGVSLSQRFGPHHGPQADMLDGVNAYEYDGVVYDNSRHSSYVTNACVDCHKAPAVGLYVGGHTFRMVAEGAHGDEEINVDNACNKSGCHDGLASYDRPASGDFDWNGKTEGVQTEVMGLLDSLKTLLISDSLLVIYPPEIDSAYYPPNGKVIADGGLAGALYNYLFIEEDRSEGIHNTKYTVKLLQNSINYLAHGDPNGAPAEPPSGPPFAALRSH